MGFVGTMGFMGTLVFFPRALVPPRFRTDTPVFLAALFLST